MTRREHEVDVLVVGSGSAGSTAAIAAARTGARTMLVERSGYLGGTSTGVLDTFYAFFTPGRRPRKVVSGIADDVVGRLTAASGAFVRPNTYGAGNGITYDPELLKRVWETLAGAAGVEILLHATAFEVELDGSRLQTVTVLTKGGPRRVRARAFVDASGDADLCHLAGAPYEEPGHDVQSLSTVFRLANVDVPLAESTPKEELWELMRQADASGEYDLPRLEGSVHRTPGEGVMMALMTRVPNVEATDPEALTRAEIEGRRQCWEYFRFLRERVPGYERAVLVSTSPAIGVRESRRILGEVRLTAEDCLTGRTFADQIARCGAPIEDHHAGRDTRWVYLEEGETYGIPFGTLLPRKVTGLIAAGRCFSATHDAHASARSMGTCMAMGQAAGTAAALSAAYDVVPSELSVETLLERLDRDGADFGQREVEWLSARA